MYILDACALIALLSKETGYETVERILEESKAQKAKIAMHTVNLLEVYYHICRLYDENSAINFLDDIKNSPLQLKTEITEDVIIRAGRLKKLYKISLADAIGLSETNISGGTFVTADHHELDAVEKNEDIRFTWIR